MRPPQPPGGAGPEGQQEDGDAGTSWDELTRAAASSTLVRLLSAERRAAEDVWESTDAAEALAFAAVQGGAAGTASLGLLAACLRGAPASFARAIVACSGFWPALTSANAVGGDAERFKSISLMLKADISLAGQVLAARGMSACLLRALEAAAPAQHAVVGALVRMAAAGADLTLLLAGGSRAVDALLRFTHACVACGNWDGATGAMFVVLHLAKTCSKGPAALAASPELVPTCGFVLAAATVAGGDLAAGSYAHSTRRVRWVADAALAAACRAAEHNSAMAKAVARDARWQAALVRSLKRGKREAELGARVVACVCSGPPTDPLVVAAAAELAAAPGLLEALLASAVHGCGTYTLRATLRLATMVPTASAAVLDSAAAMLLESRGAPPEVVGRLCALLALPPWSMTQLVFETWLSTVRKLKASEEARPRPKRTALTLQAAVVGLAMAALYPHGGRGAKRARVHA
ncbi:MAG: hypothetical protein J3K34DRAFT_434150 [Monoraphidium minutum]|nr:MAG: hypothetical protein J3K34DRAFT_434150 [Monoraphidium minutum]